MMKKRAGQDRISAEAIELPKRIPPIIEMDDIILAVDDINAANVNGFLEKYIMGALDAYNSDRLLINQVE